MGPVVVKCLEDERVWGSMAARCQQVGLPLPWHHLSALTHFLLPYCLPYLFSQHHQHTNIITTICPFHRTPHSSINFSLSNHFSSTFQTPQSYLTHFQTLSSSKDLTATEPKIGALKDNYQQGYPYFEQFRSSKCAPKDLQVRECHI